MEHDKYLEPKFSCAFGNLASKIKEKYAGQIDSLSTSTRMTHVLNSDKDISFDQHQVKNVPNITQ